MQHVGNKVKAQGGVERNRVGRHLSLRVMVAIESRDFYTLDILPLLLKAFVRGKRRDHCELHDDALFRETLKIPIEQKMLT